jgi:hypothetical protein
MHDRTDEILGGHAINSSQGEVIGISMEGHPVRALKYGTGPHRVSLLAGCHADEPVGPQMLRLLCGYLSTLSANDPLLAEYQWWIVPHINPDGEKRNSEWQVPEDGEYDLISYLSNRIRELPGDDIEFGFPIGPDDLGARPENRAVFDWWSEAPGPFCLHVSLHGMGFAAGPWFLLESEWQDRCKELKAQCVKRVKELGYTLHDVERDGEKGFVRLGRGFCTRPDSRYMRKHFLELGDEQTAALFRPSSMETVRAFGGDPLTLVSEMPLFLTPGVGQQLGPPDPKADEWKALIAEWTHQLQRGADAPGDVAALARAMGLRAMPIRDQMELQWTFIVAGLNQVELESWRGKQ